jgi:rhomboid protease GluP
MGNTEEHDEFNKAVKKSPLVTYKEPVVFISHVGSFESRNGGKFGWIFKSFGIGASVWFIMLLFPTLNPLTVRKFNKGVRTKDNDLSEMLEFLVPKTQKPICKRAKILLSAS